MNLKQKFTIHKSIYLLILLWLMLCLVAAGCSGRNTIKIGFSVELSGSRGTIGLAARNGAEMAVDQINKSGGINGRLLELLVRDDLVNPETAGQVDAELIEEGVVAIIGHITSQQTLDVYEQNNEAKIIMMSPTSSSPSFTAQDDYFFRVMQSNDDFGRAIANYIYSQGIRQLSGVYDTSNQAFSFPLWDAAKDEFQNLGGEVMPGLEFSSADNPDLRQVVAALADQDPEAVLFVASGVDTALMAQYANLQSLDADLFSSPWAATDELLQKGGAAIEGMVLNALTNPQDTAENYISFRNEYVERYGIEPGLGASHAYEAVMVLAEALGKTNGRTDGLKDALLSISDFQGVNGTITFDAYGDVSRNFYLVRVEDREFVTIADIALDDRE